MADAAKEHFDSLFQRIQALGTEARAELEWGRKNMSPQDFKEFHGKTVAALNEQVERLLGIKFED